MKATRLTIVLLCLALVLLAGCNWMQLLAFRLQMRGFKEYTAWEETPEAVFVFKKPLFTMQDLNNLGIYPEAIDERIAVLRYRRVGAPPEMLTAYEFRLQFIEGRLAGLVFPAPLREGLGRDNIRGFFAAMGGSDVPGAGISSFPKAQLISAGLFPNTPGGLGRKVMIDLRPLDPRNQALSLTMVEKQQADCYSRLEFVLKPSRMAESSGRSSQN